MSDATWGRGGQHRDRTNRTLPCARLLARVYEVDPLVCPRCGARLVDCRRQAVISSDPESRANQKDPEPSGESRSSATGTRSDHPELNGYSAQSRTAWIAWRFHAGQGAHARARRSLHRVSSNPSQPPYPRHSRRTGLRQPSLPLPQPPARPRADQSRPRCTSRVLYARSVLDYSSYHLIRKPRLV